MNDVQVVRVTSEAGVTGWAIYRPAQRDWLAMTSTRQWFWTKNPELRLVKETRDQADYSLECAQALGVIERTEKPC